MNDTDNLKAFYSLVMMPNSENERLAKIRERQRREREKKSYIHIS